jgi:hypothetical protein
MTGKAKYSLPKKCLQASPTTHSQLIKRTTWNLIGKRSISFVKQNYRTHNKSGGQ